MEFFLLLVEAVVVYGLVLGAHAIRNRVGLAHFYALIGGITAVMSWVTDAGVKVEVMGITFLVGSTVFYTSLLLGVFVVYVFDGPRATRIAISTVVGVSAMVPVIALVLNLQMHLANFSPLSYIPTPSLRINSSSVLTTLADLLFLALAWEFMNNRLQWMHYGLRAFITLWGVMCLDVLLFNTMAFGGSGQYLQIMQGTLYSRMIITLFAAPILWGYLSWQNSLESNAMEQRPLLAILRQLSEVKQELSVAQKEIEKRKKAEDALRQSQARLRRMAETDELTGLANRRRFRALGKREIQSSQRFGRDLALIMMDIDYFKRINDEYGHEAGDRALAFFADVMRGCFRQVDILGRLGGEEFGVILPEAAQGQALEAARRFKKAVDQGGMGHEGVGIGFSVSIGVACRKPGMSLDDLLKAADRALYQAKDQGRDRIVFQE